MCHSAGLVISPAHDRCSCCCLPSPGPSGQTNKGGWIQRAKPEISACSARMVPQQVYLHSSLEHPWSSCWGDGERPRMGWALNTEDSRGRLVIPSSTPRIQGVASLCQVRSVIRCQFIFSGKNDELTPDFPPGKNDELTPDFPDRMECFHSTSDWLPPSPATGVQARNRNPHGVSLRRARHQSGA